MKKIERSIQFLAEHLDLFQCPVCRRPFQKAANQSVHCEAGHQFDLSRKGTLHLLGKSGQNEYDTAMLTSRKQLADTGFFFPLLDEVRKLLPEDASQLSVLDVGCGEGSQLHYLSRQGLNGTKVGFDISRDAIQLAAGQFFEDAFWCVADLAHSPFAGEAFDVILNIFSPSHYQEFERLLKKGGRVIKVVPNPDYLIELRRQVYAAEADRQHYDNQQVVERFAAFYPGCRTQRVAYTVPLSPDTYRWLFEMTPLTWNSSKETKAAALARPLAQVTVDVLLLVGEKQQAN